MGQSARMKLGGRVTEKKCWCLRQVAGGGGRVVAKSELPAAVVSGSFSGEMAMHCQSCRALIYQKQVIVI